MRHGGVPGRGYENHDTQCGAQGSNDIDYSRGGHALVITVFEDMAATEFMEEAEDIVDSHPSTVLFPDKLVNMAYAVL